MHCPKYPETSKSAAVSTQWAGTRITRWVPFVFMPRKRPTTKSWRNAWKCSRRKKLSRGRALSHQISEWSCHSTGWGAFTQLNLLAKLMSFQSPSTTLFSTRRRGKVHIYCPWKLKSETVARSKSIKSLTLFKNHSRISRSPTTTKWLARNRVCSIFLTSRIMSCRIIRSAPSAASARRSRSEVGQSVVWRRCRAKSRLMISWSATELTAYRSTRWSH